MDYKQIGFLVVLLVLAVSLFGCTNPSFEEDKNNYSARSVSSNGLNSLIDCDSNLACLIKAVSQDNSAKAIIKSVYVMNGREYVNNDYLEVTFGKDSPIFYRKMLLGDFEIDGTCNFSKENLVSFLNNWNENSFSTDYYSNCQGAIYDSDLGSDLNE